MINPTWVDRPCSRNTEKETKMHGLCCSNSKAVWVRKVRAKEEERPSYCKRPTLFSRASSAMPAEYLKKKREKEREGGSAPLGSAR